MTQWCRGLFAVTILGLGVAGCQGALRSDLPTGPAAYQAVAVPPEIASPASYSLQAGDQITVQVFQEEDLSAEQIIIDDAGNISLPLIGEVRAQGLSPAGLAAEIETAYGSRYIRDPQVSISLLEAQPRVISVEGEVENPGVYPVEQGYTLLSAMAMAGSPSSTAKLDEVLVFREVNGMRTGARFDLIAIRSGRMPDPQILPGDAVVVGYSALRGGYQDFLRAAPLIGVFARY